MKEGVSLITWSLITVTYNSVTKLREFWEGVSLPPDVEWIVVDNNSTDGSAQYAASIGASVTRLDENVGFGGANNIGFSLATGDLVAFVNPDVRPIMEDLPTLARYLHENPNDLASPQLTNNDGSLQPNGRGAPYLAKKVLHRLAPQRLDGDYRLFASEGEVVKVNWLTGACIAGTREHLVELGPWDEHFFVYYEDTDLGIRNGRLGGQSAVLGGIRWNHGWARETRSLRLRPWLLETTSLLKFYSRYPRYLGWPRERAAMLEERRTIHQQSIAVKKEFAE